MRITVTGAGGLIGSRLVERLRSRGDDVTTLSRSPSGPGAVHWDPQAGPAPSHGLEGRDAVVHLAGEGVAQRWSDDTKRAIRSSREIGTRNLVAGLAAIEDGPGVLVSGSASGYYGARGDEPVTETDPPGDDFLAGVCIAWEREADAATALGVRVVRLRTGVVLAAGGGALSKMLPPFKLGIGGPVAGGHQQVPWIHLDDEVALILAALDSERWSGPVNACSPNPVTNAELSKALGRALHRPAVAPVPGLAIRVLYGEMARIVTTGVRMLPARAEALGFEFSHPDLDEALRDTLEG